MSKRRLSLIIAAVLFAASTLTVLGFPVWTDSTTYFPSILRSLGVGSAPAQENLVTSDLFISEYIEGTASNKAIEIYNGTGAPVDMGAGNYVLQLYSNGASAPSITYNLGGAIINGDVFVIANPSASAAILAQADDSSSVLVNFDGNDALILRKGGAAGTIVDAFGVRGVNPGTEWGTGLTSTADNTLVRKSTICAGDTNDVDAFDPATQWDGFAVDTFSNLGAHTATCGGGPLSGTVNVGAGEQFTSLTNTGGLFQAINARSLSGSLVANITSDLAAETGTFPLNQFNEVGAGGYTALIKPSAPGRLVTGSVASGCVVKLTGADRVTIDGSSNGTASRDMTITNSSTDSSSAMVCLTSLGVGQGATNDTVKNLNLVGTATTATTGTLAGVFSGLSTAISTSSNGPDNDNNTIQNNNITQTRYGIYSSGASAGNKNTGTVITRNVMNAATPNNITQGGIFVKFDDGAVISQNDISVLRNDGINTGGTGTAFGIALGVVPTDGVFTTSEVTNASVTRNKINGVIQLEGTGWSAFGIIVNTVTSGTTLVANNMIGDVRAASTPMDFSAGIFAGGGTGSTTQVYFNSVSMTGSRKAASTASFGLAIAADFFANPDPVVNVRNNIFLNTQTSTSSGKMYAIGTGSATSANLTSNFNDLFVSGTNTFVGVTGGLDTFGTDRPTLTDWQTATGKDANSISANPLFNSTTDLHINPLSPVSNAGTPIGGVTTDFDGDTRSVSTPDIGADEFVPANPGSLSLSAATYSGAENSGTITLTLSRTGGSSGAVSTTVSYSGGSATGGALCNPPADYINLSSIASWADGDIADKTVNVPICDDALFEGDETFNATLGTFTGGATGGTTTSAAVTITENDPPPAPVIQVSDVSFGNVVVGQTGMMNATIQNTGTADLVVGTVTLSGTNAADFSIPTSPSGSTVTPGNSLQFQINFTPSGTGARSASYTVSSNAGSGDNLGGLSGTGVVPEMNVKGNNVSIADGDPTPSTADFTDFGSILVAGGTQTRTFTIENLGTANLLLTGTPRVVVSGTNAADFTVSVQPSSPVAPAGTTTFTVLFDASAGGLRTATISIANNDSDENPYDFAIQGTGLVPGTLQFSSPTYSIGEAGPTATITVTRTGGSDGAIGVSYATVAGGTATGGASCTAGVDYISATSTLSWADGDSASKTFTVATCSDTTDEPDETVNLALSAPTGNATLGAQNTAALTITDDDPTPTVSANTPSVTEGNSGTTTMTFTVTLSNPSSQTVTVNYATANGTATTADGDYAATSGTATFTPLSTSQSVNVTINGDTKFETNETLSLNLSSPANATLGSNGTGTITNDDVAPTISINDVSQSEGNSGTSTFSFTVSQSAVSGLSTSVNFTTSNGTATIVDGDYVAASGPATIPAGSTSTTVNVTINGDTKFETNETFTVDLSGGSNYTAAGSDLQGQGTITNDDVAPTISINDVSLAEGNSGTSTMTFTVSLSAVSGVAATVNFATADGTATTASGDYASLSGSRTIAIGSTSQTIGITINGDTTVESDETFLVNLSGGSGYTAAGSDLQGQGTIVNDDGSLATMQFNAATYSGGEGNIVIVTVTRTGGAGTTSTVNFATSNGSGAIGGASCGTAGVDYMSTSGTLTFSTTDTSKTFPVTLCSDLFSESPAETINLTLSSPTGGTLGSQSTAVVSVLDVASEFVSSGPINPLPGDVASSQINVSGYTGNVVGLRVTLNGLNTNLADNIDVLLVDPSGTRKYVLMGDTGGVNAITNGVLTFEDSASAHLPDSAAFANGQNYLPTVCLSPVSNFAGAPAGPYAEPGCTTAGTILGSTFSGFNPNGMWTLYVRNDNGGAGLGTINTLDGWGIQFLAPTAAPVSISGRLLTADGQGIRNAAVTITGGGLDHPVTTYTGTFGYYSFGDLQPGLTYIVFVRPKRFAIANPVRAVTLTDNVAGLDFVAEPLE